MRPRTIIVAMVAFLLPAGAVQATLPIDTVPVGNPGNAADTRYDPNGFGSVSYPYNIGKYEVTAGQYTAFLNAVAATDTYQLYNVDMSSTTNGGPGITQSGSPGSYTYSVASGRANKPVSSVTFWSACRFANWLNNGQLAADEGPGTTETGAYTLTAGVGSTITRNPGATWAVTSENEWYKAAYYDPTLSGGSGGYWDFPIRTLSEIVPSMLNFSVGDTTDVGSYPYPTYYGTFDQGGNVWEWNETVIADEYDPSYFYRGMRGGSFMDYGSHGCIEAQATYCWAPDLRLINLGFRVSEVPEPATMTLLALGGLALHRRRQLRRASARVA